jgi:quercetin dioxygenase-like cupin family protein
VLLSRARLEAGGERASRYLAGLEEPPPPRATAAEVVALRPGPDGAIDEHAADEAILLLAVAGSGPCRVAGDAGTWHALAAGDAMLWPASALHAVEARDAGLEVRLVHLESKA